MNFLCCWLPRNDKVNGVVDTMLAAQRASGSASPGRWSSPDVEVGFLDPESQEPAVSANRRFHLWMAGETYAGPGVLDPLTADASRTLAYREIVLDAVVRDLAGTLRQLDGAFQLLLWDAWERRLVWANDRLGNLPGFWSRSSAGFALASCVRSVLMAPGVSDAPDLDAIREAVTFGGYRLGDRTNVAAVKLVPAGTILTVSAATPPSFREYWSWRDVPPQPVHPLNELVEHAYSLWQESIRRRLAGARRPGQTLSGGLDSRAILAEAAPQSPSWTSITFGEPGCDDANYARQAADVMRVRWVFHPLYRGGDPDWLDTRTAFIQSTDGLIQLGNLMHLETLPLQEAMLDVHLSGYIGDVIFGGSWDHVTDAATMLQRMPFYGGALGWPWERAIRWAEEEILKSELLPRHVFYRHKTAQETNLIFQAQGTSIRLRRPFVANSVVEFYEGLPVEIRRQVYPRMLLAKYPHLFRKLPNQKTGLPVGTSHLLVQLARGGRWLRRQLQPWALSLGIPLQPRIRSYTADNEQWRKPSVHDRIQATILRPASIACDVFGRANVAQLLSDWHHRAAAAAQAIGALYVFEAYHRDLGSGLAAARSGVRSVSCPRAA